ncbi:hypothetical protein [uncultured Friedmanniella sp.]|uniref:hypothetical protein n=1 Tax=uncultured Friedmanniella sp. TaxID=335381 RepID=UPI0035C94E81
MNEAPVTGWRVRSLLVWVGAALALAALRLPSFELWGDVRYTLGVERVTAAAGWPSWQVWTHRPLLNRVLMAGLDHLTRGPYREQQLLAWSSLMAAVAVGALHPPLVSRIGRLAATGLCGGLLVGLVWAPPRSLMQPEWYAVVFGIAAVAVVGQRPRSRRGEWFLALLGAALLTAAVLMKWTTIGTAAAAWTAAALLCRQQPRRLLRLTVATAVVLPLVLGLELLLVPQELLWLREIPQLNPPDQPLEWCTPLAAPRVECRAQTLVLNETLTSPVLLLLPAAVLWLARAAAGPVRIAALVIPAATIAATLATTAVQGQWFSYHVAALPVLAGGWVGWAAGSVLQQRGRPPWVSLLLMGAATAASVALLSLPTRVRAGSGAVWEGLSAVDLAYALGLGVAALGLLAAVLSRAPVLAGDERHPFGAFDKLRAWTGAFVVLLVMVGQVESVLPSTAYSLNTQSANRTAANLRAQRHREVALAARIHARIGTTATVVYLGFGDRGYWLGNPSRCRYAAATYLQRSGYLPAGRLEGFEQNLDCLADPGTAYVLIQTGWVDLPNADPRVQQAIDASFDCGDPVLDEPNTLVCRRRGSPG